MSTKSPRHHASFVGVTGTECSAIVASDRWRMSVAHSGSRVPDAARQSARPTVLIAYRGDECKFFEDDRYTVMLDGSIDNLREVASSATATVDSANQAGLIAGLFACRGESIFGRFTGSFALAICVTDSREVVLARDRFGDRPLFYARTPAGWAWASEIKSLCPLLDRLELDPDGLR